jgi:hypothetical protein
VLALLVSPAAAVANGFQWSYRFASTSSIAWGTGHGKPCSTTVFSDWHGHGLAHFKQALTGDYNGQKISIPQGATIDFKWIEPIRNDG